MDLSPEERKKIYEEEKTRLEAEEREKGRPVHDTSTGLEPHVESLLCYLGWWITGIIFFVLEQKDTRVRFHAAQSLVFFAFLTVVSIIVGFIPVVGGIFSAIVSVIGFIFWIVLMVKAYQGEHYMLPVAGEIAERMVAPSGAWPEDRYAPPPATAPPAPSSEAAEPPTAVGPPPTSRTEAPAAGESAARPEYLRRAERRAARYHRERREARITGHSFAIAFLVAIAVFFTFFRNIVGPWDIVTVSGTQFTFHSIFTGETSDWLPVLWAAVSIGVIGHVFLMFLENGILRRIIRIVMDAMGLAAVVTLLSIYPFDFSVIPNRFVASNTQIAVTATLVIIAVVFGVVLVGRLIGLLIHAGRAISGPENLE